MCASGAIQLAKQIKINIKTKTRNCSSVLLSRWEKIQLMKMISQRFCLDGIFPWWRVMNVIVYLCVLISILDRMNCAQTQMRREDKSCEFNDDEHFPRKPWCAIEFDGFGIDVGTMRDSKYAHLMTNAFQRMRIKYNTTSCRSSFFPFESMHSFQYLTQTYPKNCMNVTWCLIK